MRVPYNIPGALLYYRNTKYSDTYAIGPNTFDVPSIGPKYQLLVVDMNYGPMRIGDTPETYKGYLDSRASSYDAALTLQPTEAITLSSAAGYEGPWTYASKPAVTRFDDALGYYAGFFFGSPCAAIVCYNNYSGGAVLPATGVYTTRITDFDGAPYTDLYGTTVGGLPLGAGNPGDLGLEYGLTIDLLKKSANNAKATVRINGPPPAEALH